MVPPVDGPRDVGADCRGRRRNRGVDALAEKSEADPAQFRTDDDLRVALECAQGGGSTTDPGARSQSHMSGVFAAVAARGVKPSSL